MIRPVLLDVSALIALFDRYHLNYSAAHRWFKNARLRGWRTCPISENGFLRILSNPNYPNGPYSLSELTSSLEKSKTEGDYEFWADAFSPSSWINETGLLIPSSSSTDAYLIKLSQRNGGAFATFDLRVTPQLIGSDDATLVEHIPV